MTSPSILLIQCRDPHDPMTAHEAACIARYTRAQEHGLQLHIRNAIASPCDPTWLAGARALIIGGSGAYSVHHPNSQPWVLPLRNLLDRALCEQLPGFGLCFGHQLLCLHLGAEVRTEPSMHELGTLTVELTPDAHDDPIFGPTPNPLWVHTGHSDSVLELPKEAELLATNTTTPIQALRLRAFPFYSTQFHPDLSGADARMRATAYNLGPPNAEQRATAARFTPGHDASNALLDRFAKLIAQRA